MVKTAKPAGEKKARAPRKVKTAAELQAALEAAKKKVLELEQQSYSVEINEQIQKSNIVTSLKAVKANLKKVSDIAILTAVAKACLLYTSPSPRD